MHMTANLDHIYGTMTSRLDTIGTFTPATIAFWQTLKHAKTDYEKSVHAGGFFYVKELDFMIWLQDNWGIRLYLTDDGNYESDFEITAEDKYTMFVLKYSK